MGGHKVNRIFAENHHHSFIDNTPLSCVCVFVCGRTLNARRTAQRSQPIRTVSESNWDPSLNETLDAWQSIPIYWRAQPVNGHIHVLVQSTRLVKWNWWTARGKARPKLNLKLQSSTLLRDSLKRGRGTHFAGISAVAGISGPTESGTQKGLWDIFTQNSWKRRVANLRCKLSFSLLHCCSTLFPGNELSNNFKMIKDMDFNWIPG